MAANAGRLKQLAQQLEYSLALEDGLADANLDTPATPGGGVAAGGPAAADAAASSPSSAAVQADLLLSEALQLASAPDMGSRVGKLQLADRQRLLRYLQLFSSEAQPQPVVAAGQLQGSRPASAHTSAACRKAAMLDAVCAACERAAAADASWTCSGACYRVFHTACLAAPVTRKCSDCSTNRCALPRLPMISLSPASVGWGLSLMCTASMVQPFLLRLQRPRAAGRDRQVLDGALWALLPHAVPARAATDSFRQVWRNLQVRPALLCTLRGVRQLQANDAMLPLPICVPCRLQAQRCSGAFKEADCVPKALGLRQQTAPMPRYQCHGKEQGCWPHPSKLFMHRWSASNAATQWA